MSAEEDDKSTITFYDPVWIANSNGWIHANNVLFYFALSDFFDPLSRNQELVDQCAGVPEREAEFLHTREKMERALLDRPGLQFVVDVDPLANKVLITGPNGQQEPSELWVIRKQELLERGNPNAVRILDYYYIYNNVIFQAPRVKSVLNYRMLQSMLSVDKIVKTASDLPIFSASYGHTYLRPGQKTSAAVAAASTQASRIGTPAPELDTQATQELAADQGNESQSDEQTLRAALAITMAHGQSFYDDAPLVGEPGSFRFSTVRNPVQNLKAAENTGTGSAAATKASTPAPLPMVKPASTPASPTSAVKGNETETKPKPKRKKSMVASEIGALKNGTTSSPASPAPRRG